MTLDAIATALANGPSQEEVEAELRACFANLLAGVDKHQIALGSAKRRLRRMIDSFSASAHKDRAALRLAHMESLKFFGEEDHYLRTGPLSAFLDSRAVTIQASEDGALGDAWTGKRVRAPRIVDAFADGRCRGTVGLPGKPMWFTPYTGEMRALCEEARERKCARARRVEIARRAVSLLGLVHIHARDEVIAMVTSRTIGELGFEHPKTGDQMGPAGPTAIEARGHRRFRHWPRRSIDDRYGRTYELDGELRSKASPRDTHGAAESVRPVLPIEAFEHCIYLGRLSNPDFDDAEGDYLRTLGAPDSVSLLRDLAKATGL